MGCWLGPRWNEALGVRVCDVNPLRSEIVFGRVVVNENTTTFIETGNNTEDHRTVPVPATVMDALVARIDTYCSPGDCEAFLFLTRDGTNLKRSRFARGVLKPALIRAGLGERPITWLSLRHTAASLMFDAGLTIFDVQRRLGCHAGRIARSVFRSYGLHCDISSTCSRAAGYGTAFRHRQVVIAPSQRPITLPS